MIEVNVSFIDDIEYDWGDFLPIWILAGFVLVFGGYAAWRFYLESRTD